MSRMYVLVAVLATSALIGSCGGDDVGVESGKVSTTSSAEGGGGGVSGSDGLADPASCGTATPPTTAAPLPEGADVKAAVSARGEPEVTVPSPLPTTLTVTDLVVGTGPEVVPEDQVTVHYRGVTASDCETFESSWTTGQPATFPLTRVIPGWTQGLPGMRPGGRRHLVIPADLAYGENPSGGRPAGTLVFVVDLLAVAAKADPAALAAAEARGRPQVSVPSPLPTTLRSTDLVVGTGTAVTAGQTVIAHYVGVTADGKEFDASWDEGKPATFPLSGVIEGWQQGIPGMKVGGRRELVIPAEQAYGDNPAGGRPPGTLVFVIDLVGVG